MAPRQGLELPRELLVVGAAVETGLLDALKDAPRHAAGLAAALGLDPRATRVVLEALVELGYCAREGEDFRLSEEAHRMLYGEPEAPDAGFPFMHAYNLLASWLALPEVLRSGRPAPRRRDPVRQRHYIAAMRRNAKAYAPAVVDLCLAGLQPPVRVLDLGGGPLTFAEEFARRGAEVVVLDVPEVVEMMAPLAAREPRVTMVAGDFNVALPPGPFDLAYLGNVTHIYGETENRTLFGRVAAELRPGGRIAITDFIRGVSPGAALFAVNMLVNTERGGTWTLEQYRAWLRDAGFSDPELHEAGGRHVLLAGK
jgi:SAM-dependent methyltransferase